MSRDQRGSAGIELVLTFPVIVLGLLYIVYVGRVGTGRLEVDDAAIAGARAASSVLSEHSVGAAREAAARTVTTSGLVCTDLAVDVDVSRFEPGGSVTVAVSCTVDNGDLTLLNVPGHKTISSTFTSPIGRYEAT